MQVPPRALHAGRLGYTEHMSQTAGSPTGFEEETPKGKKIDSNE